MKIEDVQTLGEMLYANIVTQHFSKTAWKYKDPETGLLSLGMEHPTLGTISLDLDESFDEWLLKDIPETDIPVISDDMTEDNFYPLMDYISEYNLSDMVEANAALLGILCASDNFDSYIVEDIDREGFSLLVIEQYNFAHFISNNLADKYFARIERKKIDDFEVNLYTFSSDYFTLFESITGYQPEV